MKNESNKPEALSPVIQMTQPFCLSSFCLSALLTEHSCHLMFVEFPTLDNKLWSLPKPTTFIIIKITNSNKNNHFDCILNSSTSSPQSRQRYELSQHIFSGTKQSQEIGYLDSQRVHWSSNRSRRRSRFSSANPPLPWPWRRPKPSNRRRRRSSRALASENATTMEAREPARKSLPPLISLQSQSCSHGTKIYYTIQKD